MSTLSEARSQNRKLETELQYYRSEVNRLATGSTLRVDFNRLSQFQQELRSLSSQCVNWQSRTESLMARYSRNDNQSDYKQAKALSKAFRQQKNTFSEILGFFQMVENASSETEKRAFKQAQALQIAMAGASSGANSAAVAGMRKAAEAVKSVLEKAMEGAESISTPGVVEEVVDTDDLGTLPGETTGEGIIPGEEIVAGYQVPRDSDYYSNRFDRGQCTWFAQGRVEELTGIAPEWSDLSERHGRRWSDSSYMTNGTRSDVPQVGAVMVWNEQVADGFGHVAVVEKVDIEIVDGEEAYQILYSEANWDRNIFVENPDTDGIIKSISSTELNDSFDCFVIVG